MPNLFMVGFPKAGSTSLARWLAAHPQIGMGRQKETKFLLDEHNPRRLRTSFWELGLAGYAEAFSNVPERHGLRYLLDADVQYYSQRTALEQIPQLAAAPVIFLLREPVARLMSIFNFLQNNEGHLPKTMSFSEFVAEHQRSTAAGMQATFGIRNEFPDMCYAEYLKLWQDALGKDNIYVVFFEDIVRDPHGLMRRLVQRLDLSADVYEDFQFRNERPTRTVATHRMHRLLLAVKRRHRAFFERLRPLKPLYERINYTARRPSLSAEDRATIDRLNRLVRPWNEELRRLLGGAALPWREYAAEGAGGGAADRAQGAPRLT